MRAISATAVLPDYSMPWSTRLMGISLKFEELESQSNGGKVVLDATIVI